MLAILVSFLSSCMQPPTNFRLNHVTTLQNDTTNLTGLDNPRIAILSEDSKHLYIASADDDALVIFSVKDDTELSLLQAFVNNDNERQFNHKGISFLPG